MPNREVINIIPGGWTNINLGVWTVLLGNSSETNKLVEHLMSGEKWQFFLELLSQVKLEKQPAYLIGFVQGASIGKWAEHNQVDFEKQLKPLSVSAKNEAAYMRDVVRVLKSKNALTVDGVVEGMFLGEASAQDKLKGLLVLEKNCKSFFPFIAVTPVLYSKDPEKLAENISKAPARLADITRSVENIPDKANFNKCISLLAKIDWFDQDLTVFNKLLAHSDLGNVSKCLDAMAKTGVLNGPKAQENFSLLLDQPDLSNVSKCIDAMAKTGVLNGPKAAGLLKCFVILNKYGFLNGHDAQENINRLMKHEGLHDLYRCLIIIGKKGLLSSDEALGSIQEKSTAQENFEALIKHHVCAQNLEQVESQDDFNKVITHLIVDDFRQRYKEIQEGAVDDKEVQSIRTSSGLSK